MTFDEAMQWLNSKHGTYTRDDQAADGRGAVNVTVNGRTQPYLYDVESRDSWKSAFAKACDDLRAMFG